MTEVPIIPVDAPSQSPPIEPKRRWGPWTTLAWGIGAAGVMVVTQTLGVLLYLFWHNAAVPGEPIAVSDLPSNGPALTMAFIVSAPFLIGYIVLAAGLSRQGIGDYLALRRSRVADIVIGVAALAGVLLLSGLFASLLDLEAPAFTTDTFASAQASGALPLYFLAFVVLAPVQEELLFRGLLYRGLAPAFGPAPAIIVLSAIWAMFHVQYPWFFVGEIFVLGLTLGWLRWRSGSTLLTIGLHAMVNGLAMLEAYSLVDGTS
jgi:membrane protease YdiL (CAAX protease family)